MLDQSCLIQYNGENVTIIKCGYPLDVGEVSQLDTILNLYA